MSHWKSSIHCSKFIQSTETTAMTEPQILFTVITYYKRELNLLVEWFLIAFLFVFQKRIEIQGVAYKPCLDWIHVEQLGGRLLIILMASYIRKHRSDHQCLLLGNRILWNNNIHIEKGCGVCKENNSYVWCKWASFRPRILMVLNKKPCISSRIINMF